MEVDIDFTSAETIDFDQYFEGEDNLDFDEAESEEWLSANGGTKEWFENITVTDEKEIEDIVANLTRERLRSVVASIIIKNGFIRHQTDSYEKLIRSQIQEIVHENSTIVVDSDNTKRRHIVEFGDVVIFKPTMRETEGFNRDVLSWECKMRTLTYALSVMVDVTHTILDLSNIKKESDGTYPSNNVDLPLCERTQYREALLAKIPCMRGTSFDHRYRSAYLCNECPFDSGGDFIVNGSEKVIISQKSMKKNYWFCFVDKPNSKFSHVCEMRSCHEKKLRSTSTLYLRITSEKNGATPEIFVTLPFVDFPIPLIAMYKLLGIETVKEMKDMVLDNTPTDRQDIQLEKLLDSIFLNDVYGNNYQDLCDWIGKDGSKETNREKRIKHIDNILATEFLPHIGYDRSPYTIKKKTLLLSLMVYSLCMVKLGRVKPDDKDHNANERLETAGMLIAILFRNLFRAVLKNIAMHIKKNSEANKMINISDAINHKRITSGITYAMSTGNWGPQKGGSNLNGVAQVHNRMTVTSALSNMRRVSTHINKEGKMPKPRQLHLSTWGMLCPVETPEGGPCGLIRNLALGVYIRVGYDPYYLIMVLEKMDNFKDCMNCNREERRKWTLIIVNGIPVGYTNDSKSFYYALKSKRRTQNIPFDTSIVYYPYRRQMQLTTDAGCYLRPLFVIENLHKFSKIYSLYRDNHSVFIDQLLVEGVIEYISKDEEHTLRVAVNPRDLIEGQKEWEPYTHVEIHPMLLFGVCASLIPFPDHNQSPRNIYQTSMGRQSKAIFCWNGDHRTDTMTHVPMYPQVPLVQTIMEQLMGATFLPMGQNPMVIVCSLGYNMEDSVILNESSVQRGFGRSMVKRTYKDEEKSKGTDSTKFERPVKKQKISDITDNNNPIPSQSIQNTIATQPSGSQPYAIPITPSALSSCRGLRKANYEKLNAKGWVDPGVMVYPNDAIIGKTMNTEEIVDPEIIGRPDPNGKTVKNVKRDNTTILKTNEPAVVHKVIETKNRDGANILKMTTVAMRQPELGDKFSARHGQKGTVGMLYRQEDMPYTQDGIPADMVINPHGFPSRMTDGMLLEALLGKSACLDGEIGDGTPFCGTDAEEIADRLEKHGFSRYGKQPMFNPLNGKMMEAVIFFAPIFYQALKHVSIDKIHARARGPVQNMTRQPAEGRIKDGGFRLDGKRLYDWSRSRTSIKREIVRTK